MLLFTANDLRFGNCSAFCVATLEFASVTASTDESTGGDFRRLVQRKRRNSQRRRRILTGSRRIAKNDVAEEDHIQIHDQGGGSTRACNRSKAAHAFVQLQSQFLLSKQLL